MGDAAFLSFLLLTSITPGPNNIMSLSNGVRLGALRALPFNAGVFLGYLIVISGCAAFASTLEAIAPGAKAWLGWAGAAYILWLAWRVFRSPPPQASRKEPPAAGRLVLAGIALQFVNVKVLFFGLTALGTFVLPYTNDPWTIAAHGLAVCCVGAGCTCIWTVFGSLLERLFTRHGRLINTALAVLLVWCATTFVL